MYKPRYIKKNYIEHVPSDELVLGLLQAVARHLEHLVVHEAHDGHRVGRDVGGGGEGLVAADEVLQPLLHLLRGLREALLVERGDEDDLAVAPDDGRPHGTEEGEGVPSGRSLLKASGAEIKGSLKLVNQ